MPTDWRTLFDSQHITWTDRGSNARRNCVNVKCPFCGVDDPSEHMLISENNTGWHCHRFPQRHRGSNPLVLLQHLLPGKSRQELIGLLNQHMTTEVRAYVRPRADPTALEQQWARFTPADQNHHCLNYLAGRGFVDPEPVCRRYDLRYAPVGKWAARLLVPVHALGGQLTGWTGRAMRDELEPKYLTESATGAAIYVPRAVRGTAIIFEGPMDALKVSTATEHMSVTPIALLGLSSDPLRSYQLNILLRRCDQLYISLDQEIAFPQYRQLVGGLAPSIKRLYKGPLQVPRPFGDAGAMPLTTIERWIAQLLT